MKDVFKIKLPKPKYCVTWSVNTALTFLESLEPLEELTLKQLLFKLLLLLLLLLLKLLLMSMPIITQFCLICVIIGINISSESS